MQAGPLRQRIQFQSPTIVVNEFGEETKEWVDVAKRWARVAPLSGQEFWAAQQVNAEVTHRVTMRWDDGLSPTMRIQYRGRTLAIESIRDIDERRKRVEIMCKERVE